MSKVDANIMEKILDVAKRRGFFWQSSLIYGGLGGFWDYGHLGTLVKRRFQDLWKEHFLALDDNFYEIDTSLVRPEAVFKASEHLSHFVDPILKCSKCKNVERADQLLEEQIGENFEGLTPAELDGIVKKHGVKCSKCKGPLEPAGTLNMMFPMVVGTTNETTAYLTPETAQGAYLNFSQEFECLRRKLPMGLAIIGKAFRNEISPRNALIRMREFTQAELQIFFDSDTIKEHPRFSEIAKYKLRVFPVKNRKNKKIEEATCENLVKMGLPKFYVYHMARIQQFYFDLLKLPKEKFRFRELSDEEKAFYNKYHWDIEVYLESMGWEEIAGIHYRTDHDLGGHQRVSKQNMTVNIEGKSILPHVLELSFGVDRNVYAFIEMSYREEKERTVLLFPRLISPLDAGLFPLVNKDGLPEKARKIQALLKEHGFNVFYDGSGSIGRRYRRIDEIGVAAGITIDYDSLKNNDVTLRDRDSMKQVRIKIKDLPAALKAFQRGGKLEKLGK
ncbi:MAG: glycine--tRNA ligase [Candidatus Aenigmatarchaeota archaeon]